MSGYILAQDTEIYPYLRRGRLSGGPEKSEKF